MKRLFGTYAAFILAISMLTACGGGGAATSAHQSAGTYTNNGNGTVTQDATGLVWQQQNDSTGRDWATAGTYCAGLTLGGYSGWRLPTREELIGIVDTSYSPSINPIFTTTFAITSYFWSSNARAPGAWVVSLQTGDISLDSLGSTGNSVRCVSAGAGTGTGTVMTCLANITTGTYPDCASVSTGTGTYTNNGNGTVTANSTGLVWQQQDGVVKRDWYGAGTYCAGLSLGGYSGWRLPTRDELHGIVDTSYSPPINPIFMNTFMNTASAHYWSSTPYASNTTYYAWYVSFISDYAAGYGGGADGNLKSLNMSVRCVRLGQ